MKEIDIHYQNELKMLETSIVVLIVLLALAYLVRQFVATIRGRAACAGCKCKCSPKQNLLPLPASSKKPDLKEIRARLPKIENS